MLKEYSKKTVGDLHSQQPELEVAPARDPRVAQRQAFNVDKEIRDF